VVCVDYEAVDVLEPVVLVAVSVGLDSLWVVVFVRVAVVVVDAVGVTVFECFVHVPQSLGFASRPQAQCGDPGEQ
jgi:hypothetical protein